LVSGKDEEALQVKLSSVKKQLEVWFLNNDLIVNTTKTVAVSFHLCQSKPSYKPSILLQNSEIVCVCEVKFLGIHIMENLSWQAHICSLCHSLSKTCYIIKSLQNILSIRMLWNIYFACFQSQLRYGIMLWGDKRKYKDTAYSKNVIRLITGLKQHEYCRQKFKENRILTVSSLCVLEVLCFVKKYKGEI
jgi:hypothetical protein